MLLIYPTICHLYQIHLWHSHQHVFQEERALVLYMLKLVWVNSAQRGYFKHNELNYERCSRRWKVKACALKESGLVFETKLSSAECHPFKYTRTEVKVQHKNLMTQADNRWTGSSLQQRSQAGEGSKTVSPLSLCPLYSTCQPGLPSTPTQDACQPLRIELSHHFPHRVLPKPKTTVSLPSNPITWSTWISPFSKESINQTPSGSDLASHRTLLLIYRAATIKHHSQVNYHFNSTRERSTVSILISRVWETLGIIGLRRVRLAIS